MFGQSLRLVIEWGSHGKPSTVTVSAVAISLSQWEISDSKLLELAGLMGPLPCTSPTLQGSRLYSVTIIPLSQVAVVVFRKPSTLTHFSSWISPCQPSEDFRKSCPLSK